MAGGMAAANVANLTRKVFRRPMAAYSGGNGVMWRISESQPMASENSVSSAAIMKMATK
jgi:hypothetical protein